MITLYNAQTNVKLLEILPGDSEIDLDTKLNSIDKNICEFKISGRLEANFDNYKLFIIKLFKLNISYLALEKSISMFRVIKPLAQALSQHQKSICLKINCNFIKLEDDLKLLFDNFKKNPHNINLGLILDGIPAKQFDFNNIIDIICLEINNNTRLTALSLCNNNNIFKINHANNICRALIYNNYLQELFLDSNHLTEIDSTIIKNLFINNRSLKTLSLEKLKPNYNMMLETIIPELQYNSSITQLNLSENFIHYDHAVILSELIKNNNHPLRYLNLTNCDYYYEQLQNKSTDDLHKILDKALQEASETTSKYPEIYHDVDSEFMYSKFKFIHCDFKSSDEITQLNTKNNRLYKEQCPPQKATKGAHRAICTS